MNSVEQLTVFLENRKGSLATVCRILGESGYNIMALSIAETDNFGVLRLILPDSANAAQLLRSKGYTVRLAKVLVAEVPDRPSGLAEVLSIVRREDISLEYLYSFVRCASNNAVLIFKFSDPERAELALAEKGVRLLGMDEVEQL